VGQAPEALLSIENIKSEKPDQMYGDLHVTADGFYFLAFRKAETWQIALQANLGLLGMFLAHCGKKKRQKNMAQWRSEHAGRYLDELVQQWIGSQFVPKEEIKIVKSRFLNNGVVVKYGDNQKLSLETPGKQVKQIIQFAREQGWPVK
jgi:hypothetical protein